ncbi:MAG: hypothetical protein ACKOQY_01820 [Bacteroidota bacterium]
MYKALILAFFLLATRTTAQNTFSVEFHGGTGDQAVDVAERSGGGFLVLGYVLSGANSDIVLSEVSPAGVVLQSHTLQTPAYEFPKSLTPTSDGGYFITGTTFTNPSDYDMLLLKVDATFNIVFQKTYRIAGANENGNRGFELAPGLYGVAASIGVGGSAKPSFVVVDSAGDVRHQAYLNTNFFASPDYSGNYIGGGVLAMVHLTNALTLMDTAGVVLGNFSGNIGLFTTDVLRLPNGGFACVAASDYGSPTGGSLSIGILDSTLSSLTAGAKFKVNGNEMIPVSLVRDPTGNFYIAARAISLSTGNPSPNILKTDASGNLIWCKNYKPASAPAADVSSLRLASDGSLLLCGSAGPWNNQHLYFNKIDTAGVAPCNWGPFSITQQALSQVGQTLHSPASGVLPAPVTGSAVFQADTLMTDALCASATDLEEISQEEPTLQIAPSVFSASFRLQFEETAPSFISVCSVTGQHVVSGYFSSGESLDSSSWPAGCYLISATFSSGKSARIRGLKVD